MTAETWKKGAVYEGTVEDLKFPDKGVVRVDGIEGTCIVKHALPMQRVEFCVTKRRNNRAEGRLLSVLAPAPYEIKSDCPHSELCGGCSYRTVPYAEQLKRKEQQVRSLLSSFVDESVFCPILESPVTDGYRNKMEFSFGDSRKDGPLELGLHKRGSFYDVLSVPFCRIVDEDYRKILRCTLDYFRELGVTFYHKRTHEGFLRHLLVRKAAKTGEILVDLVTAGGAGAAAWNAKQQLAETAETKECSVFTVDDIIDNYVNQLQGLELSGKIVGILHTANDALSDTIRNDGTRVLFGQDHFYEELLGLRFLITPFSFFQTNSGSAEVLYDTVRKLVTKNGGIDNNVIYDLYSGTGTIAQILSPVAKRVIGVEIVEEAVEAAKENARLNGLHNCEFLAGDVLKVLDEIEEKPDFIVLDPPRDGIHPKALSKIIAYGVERIVYISCKPTSLARDLPAFLEAGYTVETVQPIDQFPFTVHVETVCSLQRK